MRKIWLPRSARALIFDLDSTLYTNPEYASFQTDCIIEGFARDRGVSVFWALREIERIRTEVSARTGRKTSLGNAMAELGLDIPGSVALRERLIRPEEWLFRDERLLSVLTTLSDRYSLAVVTNNPHSIGERSLRALGVLECFRTVVGLDDTMVSKPAREPFEAAAIALSVAAGECVSIGDRYDIDIAIPLEIGMGGILVEGVEDVYNLPEIL